MADNRQNKHTATDVEDLRTQAQAARTAGDDQRAVELEQQIRDAESK